MDTMTVLEKIIKYFAFIPFIIGVISLPTLIRKRKDNKYSIKIWYIVWYSLFILMTLLHAILIWKAYN